VQDQTPSLAALLAQLQHAAALLRDAERAWPRALAQAGLQAHAAEVAAIEDLLHVATHETESQLGFLLQDIDRLLAQVALRKQYDMFQYEEVDRIVASGWSAPFVRELHRDHPSIPIGTLSAQVKGLCADWGRLEKITASRKNAQGTGRPHAGAHPRGTSHEQTMRIAHLAECPAHIPLVASWQHVEFGYLTPSVGLEARAERLRQSLVPGSLPLALLALSEEGVPVGAAGIQAKTITHQHLTPWLSAVVVPPEHRNKGIASALALRALEEAAALGFDHLFLFTPRNESLYARLGWTTMERTQHNGVEMAIMARRTRA